MQHGSALPFAVKYITVQGLRHIDQGEPLSLRFRLIPGSDAAPEALKVTPRDRASEAARSICADCSLVSCS